MNNALCIIRFARSLRCREIAANVSIIGTADGSIIAIIMIAHMPNTNSRSLPFHAAVLGIAMSTMSMCRIAQS